MPSAPTGTSYAVLGLLSLRSWTTYELAQQVRRSLNWFWPRAERKLYQEPKALVERGLATSRTEPGWSRCVRCPSACACRANISCRRRSCAANI